MMGTDAEVTGPINLGNPNEMTVRELAEVILDLTGSRSKIIHRPLPPDDPRKRRPDISDADRLLGWRTTTPLKEGLAETIPYFERLIADGKLPNGLLTGGVNETPVNLNMA